MSIQNKMKEIILGREESFAGSPQVWSFCKASDIVNNINLRLGNMAGGFPFKFKGHTWQDSERLYLCGKFSGHTDQHQMIQQALFTAPSSRAARSFVEFRFRDLVRPDFKSFRLQWMLYVVWQKCQNNESFRQLLLNVPQDAIIVEDRTTDSGESAGFWGCRNLELHNARVNLETILINRHKGLTHTEKSVLVSLETNKINTVGQWKGQNNMGKILMICRDSLAQATEPEIDYELLGETGIHILDKMLFF